MMQTWGRRDFIRIGALGGCGLQLGDYLSLRAQTRDESGSDSDKGCIMIVLDGGPPQHETFDMKPDAPSDIRGTFKPIATNVPGIQICEHLPKTARQADKFAILRSVNGKTAIHFNGVYFLMTGYLPIQSVEFPSLGAVVAKELGLRKGMPPYVLNAMLDHAMGPGFLGSAYAPFWVRSDPNAPDFRVDDLDLPVDVDWKTVSDRRWLVKQMDQVFRDRDTKGITENLIHLLYQPAPVGDCLPIYVYGKVQVVHPEIRRIGIGSHPEWRIGAAEKAGAHGVVQHGIQDIGWHAFAQPQFLRHHCAKRWKFHRLDGQVTRTQKVNAIEVDRGPAPNRAQDRELVHLRCDLGQMLPDLDS